MEASQKIRLIWNRTRVLRGPRGLCILQNGNAVVGDEYYLHYFQPDTFIKRVNASSARYYVWC